MASSLSDWKKMVYQFKIKLRNTQPPIWRRIEVPEDYTFFKFHRAIIDSMGWLGDHMHEFRMINHDGKEVEIGIADEHIKCIDERKTRISNYFSEKNRKCEYEYDFGDGWEHEILFEGKIEAIYGKSYPRCIAGENACPPEDVGGVYGFYEFCEKIADPTHEEYDELIEWAAEQGHPNYDPARFDPSQVEFDDSE